MSLKKKLIKKKLKLLRFIPYEEKYNIDLDLVYTVKTFKNAVDGPASWAYTKQNLKGHAMAIGQTSNVRIVGGQDSGDATHLILNYKRYYDADIRVNVLARDRNRFGIVFRYLDQFNYYAFDMYAGSEIKERFKRVRKIINGRSFDLQKINDGGYLQDTWYKILIQLRKNKFKIFMEEESSSNMQKENEAKMSLVFEAYDSDLAIGAVGFSCNGMAGLYLDNFNVEPVSCNTPSIEDQLSFITPTCSRFKDSYFADFGEIWNPIDPQESKDGPSMWKYTKNFEGQPQAIVQGSLIYSGSGDKEPSILELKLKKICNAGVLQVDFFAKSDGYVGVAFHYLNQYNHYTAEIGGEKLKFCQARKSINGNYQIVDKIEGNCGYVVNKWYTLLIHLKKSFAIIYLAPIGESLVEVLTIPYDDEFKDGKVALLSFKTNVGFNNFKIMPAEDSPLMIDTPQVEDELSVSDTADGSSSNTGSGTKGVNSSGSGGSKVSAELCFQNPYQRDREKYCRIKFSSDVAAAYDCQVNFCDRCCDSIIDNLHPFQRYECVRKCKSTFKDDNENQVWMQCIESSNPNKSQYQYCENSFPKGSAQTRCKVDLCKMCCANIDAIFNLRFDTKTIHYCDNKCIENYLDPEDVLI